MLRCLRESGHADPGRRGGTGDSARGESAIGRAHIGCSQNVIGFALKHFFFFTPFSKGMKQALVSFPDWLD